MNEDYIKLLIGFPIFRGFTPDGGRMLIERGEIKEFAPGEVIWREGDAAACVLVMLTGKLQVFVVRQERDLVLSEPGPGAILGELAVLCAIPRSASTRALEKSVALCWSDKAFRRLLLGDAFLSERILGEALRMFIERERAMIDSLVARQRGEKTAP